MGLYARLARHTPMTQLKYSVRRLKHGNKKTIVDGITFDSQREAKRYGELKLLQKAGEISNLQLQMPYKLVDSVKLDGRKKPSIRYIADFVYWIYAEDDYYTIIEDAKSPHLRKNPVYRLKKHLLKAIHGMEIKEV